MTRVSLVRGKDRREIIRRSLDLIADDVIPPLPPSCIKPPDQIREISDFLMNIWQGAVIIAEASCCDTVEACRNFDYLDLL